MTDVGSTKDEVVRIAREELRERFARFVPGHPIAGRETSGVEAAIPDLFRGARVVLTPVAQTAPDALALVRELWEAVGGRVATLAPGAHDRIFAAVSHLPHILSFALVSEIAAREQRRGAPRLRRRRVSATSRASRRAPPRCGATSRCRTARRSSRRSIASRRDSPSSAR